MKLEWNDAMASGVKEIDDAHKILIKGINQLNSAMKSGNGRLEVLKIVDFLGKYAKMHFAHEESCMNKYQCPAALLNKKAHDNFINYFAQMKNNLEVNGVTVASVIEIRNALGDWLKTHIMKIDTCLAPCVKENQVQYAGEEWYIKV